MLGFGKLAKILFGSANDRYLKGLAPRIIAINALEEATIKLSDEELKAKTIEFRERFKKGETLDDLLVESFAVVREAAKRTLGQRHYDVQLIGGIVLHENKIAEMRTGEGKTLVSTLSGYLNALPEKGVHVVTVNDYLAARDSEWMGQVFTFLGMTTGCVVPSTLEEDRKAAYQCDITYATNNELGFDYLRDNMKFHEDAMVQREPFFAIVDEVDSILVDEARTPLVISGATDDKSELYHAINEIIPKLTPEDYDIDEKANNVTLTEEGMVHLEQILTEAKLIEEGSNMYDFDNVSIVHHSNQALKAHTLFQREKDYIVKGDDVIIVDEFTGRMMEGRRYGDGLHQALEAKEGVFIQAESQTLASVTFQNYFRLYEKLSGMTGTAATEAAEFADIYSLGVIEIPTNLDISRVDEDDEIYRSVAEKFGAIAIAVEKAHAKGQPILVGTVSIERSEQLSKLFKEKNIPHNVLNAKLHEKEAYIVGSAGRFGAVTIATNMAGRGTDIQLGGNFDMRAENELDGLNGTKLEKARAKLEDDIRQEKTKVIEAGGLFVLGTERHESRRIDNQLRGRSGRQGDPGLSKFYLSMEDDLMRIFGGDRMDKLMTTLGFEEGESLVHPWLNRAVEKSQEKVEARNYDQRKHLLKFDDVMNDQRTAIYEQRKDIIKSSDLSETVKDMRHEVIGDLIDANIDARAYPADWNINEISEKSEKFFAADFGMKDWVKEEGMDLDAFEDRLFEASDKSVGDLLSQVSSEDMRLIEKQVLLTSIDQYWKEHLAQLDSLRNVIQQRAYGQRDPLNEYKTEAFGMFEKMLLNVRENVTSLLSHIQIQQEVAPMPNLDMSEMSVSHLDPITGENDAGGIDKDDPSTWGSPTRNELCPCGSGNKFKHCHGMINTVVKKEKVGRNEPCPCSSGKKFKHCHGAL
jgi:preprotein translocase subunit SecA